MKLDMFRTLWGVTDPVESFADKLKEVGFVGVEARVPDTAQQRRAFKNGLSATELGYIGIIFTGGDVIPNQAENSADHLARLDRKLGESSELAPRFINVLAGCDRWSATEKVEFFGRAQELADKHGMTCSFETHRGSALYSPWVTLELLSQLPTLKFTWDISHWMLVSERLLNAPSDDFTPFIEQVFHLQARVGYDQGAQVPHPAAPEYKAALECHQRYWEAVWRRHLRDGVKVTTMTTEFGPDGYLHHLPFTDVPVADLWSLNDWIAIEERRHFDRFINSSSMHGKNCQSAGATHE